MVGVLGGFFILLFIVVFLFFAGTQIVWMWIKGVFGLNKTQRGVSDDFSVRDGEDGNEPFHLQTKDATMRMRHFKESAETVEYEELDNNKQ